MGIQRLENEEARLKYFQESLGSIREIKILGKVDYLVKKFSIYNTKAMKIIRNSGLITIFPRLAIETFLVFLISIVLVYFLFLNYSFPKIILILGMLGACAFRMMPIITKIINSFNLIQYSKPSLDALYEYFKDFSNEIEKEDSSKINDKFKFNDEITFNNVSFFYSDKDKFKFENLNFKIKKGDRIGIVGETGSGKSTLIDLILGLIEPKSGQIEIDQLPLKTNRRSWNKIIGYVPQMLVDDTISKNIGLGFEEENLDKENNQLIKICNLENISEFSDGINNSGEEDQDYLVVKNKELV